MFLVKHFTLLNQNKKAVGNSIGLRSSRQMFMGSSTYIARFVRKIAYLISSVADPGFFGHPDPDPDPGKKFTDPDLDPDPSSTIIFKSQNNGI